MSLAIALVLIISTVLIYISTGLSYRAGMDFAETVVTETLNLKGAWRVAADIAGTAYKVARGLENRRDYAGPDEFDIE